MFIAYAVKCLVKTALVAFCANGEHINYFEKDPNRSPNLTLIQTKC